MTKPHTKWLQDIEISVYLPIFSLKNVILGLLNCSAPVALIRIKRYLSVGEKKNNNIKNREYIAVLLIYLSIYLFILRNCIIFPLNDYILKLRR